MLRRVRQSLRQVLFLMARRPDLLCGAIVLGVLLILAVKFTCSRAKNVVAAARPPVRFFSAEAPVVDLYLGQLDQVERLRSMAEVSLIFFYAPWCAHSMAARQEVQQVAKKLAKQVWTHRVQRSICGSVCGEFHPQSHHTAHVPPIKSQTGGVPLLPRAARVHHVFVLCPAGPQRDYPGVVRFGVVTNRQVAEAISLKEDETVYLHRRFNSSLIFPRRERNFTSEAICSWVFEHLETVLQWMQPPGTKSRLLEQELSKGPALLLFLPHNPLGAKPNPILQQIADIAVRYHSCDSNNNHSSLDANSLCCQSVLLPESSTNVCEVCHSSSKRCSLPSASARGGDVLQPYLRHCCLHQLPAPVSVRTATSEGCSNFLSSYSPFSQYSACCRKVEPQLNESQAKEGPDVQRAPLTPPPSSTAPASLTQRAGDGITGLRCQTNRTLRFYVLDMALNWPLAVRLGATGNRSAALHQREAGTPGDEGGDGSFAAIVNLKDEVHYVLHRSPAATLTESLGCVDVVLFYYTQWCGFCSVLNHIIIQLARLLQGNSTITVARVNVARNDLPWEFMADHVPSILLFPRYRKHLSVKFPDDLPITLPNLLRFILQHSGSVHDADKPVTSSVDGNGSGPGAILRAEFLSLQRQVQALHHARERLSQQLAQLWRDNRRLTFDARSLEAQNAELQRERESLEEQHQEKSRQLGEAVRRLQELADTSENLLNENTLLRILLRALKDRTEAREQAEVEGKEAEQKRSHMAS
ncbi:hypothetical protein INR49_016174 [Caranx melampygus]|nr:hypothetical protein INR49_016174 [Caranx melampygus]